MPIESPLERAAYEAGALIQACHLCDWAQDGHLTELGHCPSCGAELNALAAIHFGGTMVIYNGCNFEIYSNNGGFVALERADYADIIAFICRHGTDDRAEPSGRTTRVRRIAKAQDFNVTCEDAWRRPRRPAAE